MVKVFFSYSHKDETLRDELENHLSILKRQGIIETWHDRRIGAGKEIPHEISENLENADIILLLVSPYFLASDYCYDVEMNRAMERHEKKEARVIPVILQPCDWKETPFGKLMATPNDGRPISKFPNIHDGFLEVTIELKKAAKQLEQKGSKQKKMEGPTINRVEGKVISHRVRSSNLRIKKNFTDQEKDRFLSESFEYIANFFEGSLEELSRRNKQVTAEFRRIDANHFSATIYINEKTANRCQIWLGGRDSLTGGIAYSVGEYRGNNSYNESLSIQDDGYSLFLKPLGMSFRSANKEEGLNLEGGAEYLWQMFIEPLQN